MYPTSLSNKGEGIWDSNIPTYQICVAFKKETKLCKFFRNSPFLGHLASEYLF